MQVIGGPAHRRMALTLRILRLTRLRAAPISEIEGPPISEIGCYRAVVMPFVLSATDRHELGVVARRAQPALSKVLHERAKVADDAALDPQETVGAPRIRKLLSAMVSRRTIQFAASGEVLPIMC